MTINEIEKIRDFLDRSQSCNNFEEMHQFYSEVRGYFTDICDLGLRIRVRNTQQSYSYDFLLLDKKTFKGYFERKLDGCGSIINLLDFIKEGTLARSNQKKMEAFLVKAYYSYGDSIKFDSVIKAIATQNSVPEMQLYKVNETMLDGILMRLRQYGETLCSANDKRVGGSNGQTITINNVANANSNISIDIAFAIEEAKQCASDEGLPDKLLEEVIKKLDELAETVKQTNSKGKRWQKAKEIMKWLLEQGIQVASIVVPVLATSIK